MIAAKSGAKGCPNCAAAAAAPAPAAPAAPATACQTEVVTEDAELAAKKKEADALIA